MATWKQNRDVVIKGWINAGNKLVARSATDFHSRVVFRTPVDTGLLRASWEILVGKITSASVRAFPNITEFNLTSGRAASIRGKVAGALARIKNTKRFLTLTVTNPQPYVGKIEDGSSRQAPAGMIRVSLVEVASVYR